MSAPHYLGVWDTLWYYLVLPCTSSDSYSLAEAFYPDKPPTVFTLTILEKNAGQVGQHFFLEIGFHQSQHRSLL